jgi:hypothetical protein
VPLALWEEIVFSQDDETLRRHLDAAGLHDIDNAYHVAIDRWTGGSAPDLLFTAVEPHAVAWGKLRMTLHLSRLPLEIWRPATALLLAILRELRDGRLPLGHGINRGCGSVRVCSIALRPRGCAAEVVPDVDDLTLAGQDAWLQRLNAAWQDWLDRAGAAK